MKMMEEKQSSNIFIKMSICAPIPSQITKKKSDKSKITIESCRARYQKTDKYNQEQLKTMQSKKNDIEEEILRDPKEKIE